jgi:hypothetical protein
VLVAPSEEPFTFNVYRGTNWSAKSNTFLGKYQISSVGTGKRPLKLMFVFDVSSERSLSMQVRTVGDAYNDALKVRRISSP